MKITFKSEQIELSQGCEKTYLLKELNAESIVEILEFCIKNEEDLSFELNEDASPISVKLLELIKSGLKETQEIEIE